MSFLDYFRSPVKEEAPSEPTQTLVVTPKEGLAIKSAVTPVTRTFLRRGMWVLYNGQISIIDGFEPDNIVTIHKVLPDGTSEIGPTGRTVEYHVLGDTLTLASYADIPEPRRPEPDHAAKFGYV
jgi:hypothetical protein